jgi:hypothetical protein
MLGLDGLVELVILDPRSGDIAEVAPLGAFFDEPRAAFENLDRDSIEAPAG